MRRADLAGTYGQAWEYRGDRTDEAWREDAYMGGYLIHAPAAHPLRAWHLLMGIHLRPDNRAPTLPFLRFPGATHEIMVLALNPEHDAALDPDDRETFKWLEPPDVTEQVVLGSDDQARELVRLCATGCVHGVLVPDSDFRSAWRASLEQTSEHLRLGGHPA